MRSYICNICGWEYNPEVGCPDAGIEPGIPFEDLPDDFECPECGAGILIEKRTKKEEVLACLKKECGYKEDLKQGSEDSEE